MPELIVELVNAYGYIGIIILIAVENVFPPIPSEVILTFSGFLTTYSNMNRWGVIFAATIGSVLGAIVLYMAGKILTTHRLMQILNGRCGKILRFNKDDVKGALVWFNTKGKKTVFFCRCIPIMRSLISIPAGMAKMDFGLFVVLTASGSFIWNVVLVHLGCFAGASWELVLKYVDVFENWVIIMLALIITVVIIIKRRRRRRH